MSLKNKYREGENIVKTQNNFLLQTKFLKKHSKKQNADYNHLSNEHCADNYSLLLKSVHVPLLSSKTWTRSRKSQRHKQVVVLNIFLQALTFWSSWGSLWREIVNMEAKAFILMTTGWEKMRSCYKKSSRKTISLHGFKWNWL